MFKVKKLKNRTTLSTEATLTMTGLQGYMYTITLNKKCHNARFS
jgi:hypothetical protein